MGEVNMPGFQNGEPHFASCIPVIGLGTRVTPVFQSVRSQIEERNRKRRYREEMQAWWLWSFGQVPTGLKLNTEFAQKYFKSANIFFLLVDTADETAVQNAEFIGRDSTALIITILLGDGSQDIKERIASAVDCFVDLREERLEQYKKQDTEQLAYHFIRSIMAPMEEFQMVSVDFDDIQQMFSHGGEIHWGIGYASFKTSEDDAPKTAAIEEALRGLKSQCDLRAIQRSFLSIECAEGAVSILDCSEAINEIDSFLPEDACFILSISASDDMTGHVRAVLLGVRKGI